MKRLIVCSDGTWQSLKSDYPTNVVKTAQAILPTGVGGVPQIVYYDEGLGTEKTGSSAIDKLITLGGGGLGLGIDYNIQQAYRFLCLNYEPGDEIYLFGFSRGAYTVRSLAGLIYNSGLPSREHIRKIPEAYELYRNKDDSEKPSSQDATNFRQKYCARKKNEDHFPPIKALCCWDTVASLGIPDLIPGIKLEEKFNERYRFHDHKINKTIERAFHAVAIDERRSAFDFTPMESVMSGQLSQVWFPGDHGCVGGGSEQNRSLSDRTLEWMLDKVKSLGLEIDPQKVRYSTDKDKSDKYGIYPNHKAPFKAQKTKLCYKNREFPNTSTSSDLDISVKKRWKDNIDGYRDNSPNPNLKTKFGQDLDRWNGIE